MNINKNTFLLSARSALGLALAALVLFSSGPAFGQVIVDDSFKDGDRANTGPLQSNWWVTSSLSGIEASPGILGHVTGTSGRGIHTIFPTQSLNVGDSLKATYTFMTPATVADGTGSNSGSFRIGLFDSLERAGLDADVESSSSSPNDLLRDLPGYMLDMDVNKFDQDGPNSDLNFRQHNLGFTTGRLMATTGSGSFSSFSSGPDVGYEFLPETAYQGSFMVTRTGETAMELTGTIGAGPGGRGDPHSYSVTDDEFDSASFGMFAIHANSNQFGSTNSQGEPDNGIDYTNIRIEYNAVPEPSLLGLLVIGMLGLLHVRRHR